MATELPTPKERYTDFAQWLQETFGYTVDAAQAQVAVTRYHDFQASDFNRNKNAARLGAARQAREERSAGYAQRRADAEAKRQEREAAKAAREEERARKAEEKAARDAEKGAAAASAPKRSRKGKGTSQEALAEADGAAGEVTFESEGSAREVAAV